MTRNGNSPRQLGIARGAQNDMRKSIDMMLAAERDFSETMASGSAEVEGPEEDRPAPRGKAQQVFAPLPPADDEQSEEEARAARAAERRSARIRWLQRLTPSIRHVALIAVVALCAYRPWIAIGVFLVTLWVVLAVYLVMGAYRMRDQLLRLFLRFERARPEDARTVRLRAQRVSDQAERLMNRLPDSWTDGITLPDFRNGGRSPAHPMAEPFERLAEGERRRRTRRLLQDRKHAMQGGIAAR